MASKLKPTIGRMACLCCGEPMPVKKADNGTLDLSCKECDFSAYAKAGTEAHAIAMKSIKLRAQEEPATEPPAKPGENGYVAAVARTAAPTPPPPATRRRASIFDLGAEK